MLPARRLAKAPFSAMTITIPPSARQRRELARMLLASDSSSGCTPRGEWGALGLGAAWGVLLRTRQAKADSLPRTIC